MNGINTVLYAVYNTKLRAGVPKLGRSPSHSQGLVDERVCCAEIESKEVRCEMEPNVKQLNQRASDVRDRRQRGGS